MQTDKANGPEDIIVILKELPIEAMYTITEGF